MKKIAIINQKGGVGKSTKSANMSYELATTGNTTLLVDIDPQSHSCAVYVPEQGKYTIKDLFSDSKFDAKQAVVQGIVQGKLVNNLFIIPSNIQFAKVAEQISSRIHREKLLHNHLKKLDYDYVLLDCPPNLGVITINAIYTADLILIPVNYDKGALDGMADLMSTIREVKESSDAPYLILRNEFDARNKQTNAYIEAELEPFKDKLLKTKIRKTEAINQARIADEPIQVYDPQSNGTADYKELIAELITYV
jgi:chromosome partitioning protein